jgi:hypothetical protein
MRLYPAVDSNTLTYLLVDERLAMVWCLFFGNCSPWVPPTVQIEYDNIKAAERRDTHDRWTKSLLQDMPLNTPEQLLQARAEELLLHHNKISDCRVVAETEFAGLEVVLSCDGKMRRRLQPHMVVKMLRPTEFWRLLGITEEPDTVTVPAPGNPLRDKTWWKFPRIANIG